MVSKITRILLIFLWLAIINCNGNGVSSESPGFFLKVTKNVPRLGRRAHSLSDFENFFLKTSKSVPRIGRSENQFIELPDKHSTKQYSSIQPFDSKSLHHLLASDAINENDIKFISWDDFDVALENDDGLFEKLLALANDQQSMPMLAEKLSQDSFIPLGNDENPDKYYYRVNRSGNDKITMSE